MQRADGVDIRIAAHAQPGDSRRPFARDAPDRTFANYFFSLLIHIFLLLFLICPNHRSARVRHTSPYRIGFFFISNHYTLPVYSCA